MRLRLIRPDTTIDFLGRRKLFLVFSALLVLGAIASNLTQGLNFGIDFQGGVLIEVRADGPADLAGLRSTLAGLDLGNVSLQGFGQPSDVLIRVQRQAGGEEAQLDAINRIKDALGPGYDYRRTEFVGPKVGGELRRAGTIAVLLAIGAILLYIWFRFEWQFGVAAVVALAHDVIATMGLFSALQLEFNLSTLAAILTIAGYSINDTVVIFDRVRENLRRYKRLPMIEVLNKSINETLSRTFMTSLTTLLALLALFFLGGAVIHDFSLAMIWGVVVGTYSSIGLAVPILYLLNVRREGAKQAAVPAEEG